MQHSTPPCLLRFPLRARHSDSEAIPIDLERTQPQKWPPSQVHLSASPAVPRSTSALPAALSTVLVSPNDQRNQTRSTSTSRTPGPCSLAVGEQVTKCQVLAARAAPEARPSANVGFQNEQHARGDLESQLRDMKRFQSNVVGLGR